jgi:putative spermidine/putrescine transport system ATP-binding protein
MNKINPDCTAKVQIRGIRKTYGPVVALEGVDLEVYDNEFMTLLGPSGSGKTTLLMSVAGLIQPESGEIWIDGQRITYMPPNKRGIGVVFQSYALFPHMTVAENIGFPLKMRNINSVKINQEVQRVLESVQLANITDIASRLPQQLSGGQQQRVALARCMIYRPSVILMDEPLGALDKKLREKMQLEIKRLHTELGTTILYVTHDQEEALSMSDKICLMNNGRIEQMGTPDQLYFEPATLFAAEFLGESTVVDVTVRKFWEDRIEVFCPSAGARLVGRKRFNVSLGDQIKAVIRPENVCLLGAKESASNEVVAILRNVIRAGEVTRFYGELRGGDSIIATNLTRAGNSLPNPGTEVRFGWSEEVTTFFQRKAAS